MNKPIMRVEGACASGGLAFSSAVMVVFVFLWSLKSIFTGGIDQSRHRCDDGSRCRSSDYRICTARRYTLVFTLGFGYTHLTVCMSLRRIPG
jgi:hypothetical protein